VEIDKENTFTVNEIFVSFISVKGCSLAIQASFPTEFQQEHEKREKPRRNFSNKELRVDFAKQVRDKTEEISESAYTKKIYLQDID
jgi:hypothetical protein